jgi:hypothetical protein
MMQANFDKVVTEWTAILIDRLKKQIVKKNIGQSGELLKSFVSNIIRNSNGNPQRIEVMFNFYGRFVDMGVGNGQSLSGVARTQNNRNRVATAKRRRPKKWYAPTRAAEERELAKILVREFGIKGISIMEESLMELVNERNKIVI